MPEVYKPGYATNTLYIICIHNLSPTKSKQELYLFVIFEIHNFIFSSFTSCFLISLKKNEFLVINPNPNPHRHSESPPWHSIPCLHTRISTIYVLLNTDQYLSNFSNPWSSISKKRNFKTFKNLLCTIFFIICRSGYLIISYYKQRNILRNNIEINATS